MALEEPDWELGEGAVWDEDGVSMYSESESSTVVSSITGPRTKVRKFNYRLLPTSRNSGTDLEVLGFCKDCIYRYKQPVTAVSSPFVAFLSNAYVPMEHAPEVSESLAFMEYRPPSVEDLKTHLRRFASPRTVQVGLVRAYESEVLSYMEDISGSASYTIRDWLTPANLLAVKFPTDTSAGLRWGRLGFRSKREASGPASREALDWVIRLSEGEVSEYVVPPCKLGGRGKIVDTRTVKGGKEGRLIVIPDLVRHLLGSMCSKPYARVSKAYRKDRGGTLIGIGAFNMWYDRLANAVDKAADGVGFMVTDFSGYDQTVPEYVINTIMDRRIRLRFDECKGASGYWRSEKKQLVHTEIALPEGVVVKKKRGISSGDPWTSLVGSEAHEFMALVVFKLLGVTALVWVFGDDSLMKIIYCPFPLSELTERYTKKMFEVFGLEVKGSASYATGLMVQEGTHPVVGKGVEFLSAYFFKRYDTVVPVPAWEKCLEGLMYPEKNPAPEEERDMTFERGDHFTLEIVRCVSYFLVYYWNEPARLLIEQYHRWLIGHKIQARIEDITPLARKIIVEELSWDPSLFFAEWIQRLPTFCEMLDLYLGLDLIHSVDDDHG